jgi:hypothetical protein
MYLSQTRSQISSEKASEFWLSQAKSWQMWLELAQKYNLPSSQLSQSLQSALAASNNPFNLAITQKAGDDWTKAGNGDAQAIFTTLLRYHNQDWSDWRKYAEAVADQVRILIPSKYNQWVSWVQSFRNAEQNPLNTGAVAQAEQAYNSSLNDAYSISPVIVASVSQYANFPTTQKETTVAQQAQVVAAMPVAQQSQVVAAMPIAQQAQVVAAMPVAQQAQVVAAMPAAQQAQVVAAMPAAQQAQVVAAMPATQQAQVVTAMQPEKSIFMPIFILGGLGFAGWIIYERYKR